MAKIGINTDSLKAGRDWKRHKVVDGTNTFRFLPPFGDPEVHNGYPYRKWSTIWLIDPTSGKRKPFASPYCAGEDKCPVKEYADLLATKLEDIASEMKAAGSSEEEIKARLAPARSEQWRLKLNHTFAYNATDKSGTVGLLEIKKTAHDGVKAAMSKYIKDYAQDPTTLNSEKDDSGIWMNINREGLGKDTKYTVEFNSMMVNHPELGKVRKDDRSPLSENVVNNYDSLGYDLSSIYSIKTYNELKSLLVANLKLLAKNGNDKFNSIPDLLIPEFMDTPVQETQAEAVSEPVAGPTVPQGKKPVTLNLGGNDEGEDAPVNTTVKAQVNNATVETVAATTSDDIFAMADEFLND
jgi:hypothetical protein